MGEYFVQTYGYIAILFGTFIEGETILILGGIAAHMGYLSLPVVIIAALAGALAADQLYFFLGRRHGEGILLRRPSWKLRMNKSHKLIERFQTPIILFFRFLYGLRTVIPFAIGTSMVPTKRFFILNIIGALIWAITMSTGGYLFGSALELILHDIKRYEYYFLAFIVFGITCIWIYRHVSHKKSDKVTPRSFLL